MEHSCEICKEPALNTTREILTKLGWKGMEGRVNGHPYNFYFCEKHNEKECVDYFSNWMKSLPQPKMKITAINGKKVEDPHQKLIDRYKSD